MNDVIKEKLLDMEKGIVRIKGKVSKVEEEVR